MGSEEIWRAALHDFNNLLGGVQGLLELTDPHRPLDALQRNRLLASLREGRTLVDMARALALGRYPESGRLPWVDWQRGLEERLEPLGALFRCRLEVLDGGASGCPWPAPDFQDWAAAFTRQVLPWASQGELQLEARAVEGAWTLTWLCDAPVPSALQPDLPDGPPRNLHGLWLRDLAGRMGVSLDASPRGPVARLARP